jgi:hypothetical protein
MKNLGQSMDSQNSVSIDHASITSTDKVYERERISTESKVNFTKLTEEEKKARFLNMAKKIKSLKARIRLLEAKVSSARSTK